MCLIGAQKGVSKTSKGHLLQANWTSFRSQLDINKSLGVGKLFTLQRI